jgi:hypothetical protein
MKTALRFPQAVKPVALVLLAAGLPAQASHIETPAQLKAACEADANHVVQLDHSTKIFLPGPGTAVATQVASGCTLVLGQGAKLETEFIRVNFNGQLTVQSAYPTDVKLVKTSFQATAITLDLGAQGSALGASEATLAATAGDLNINLGDEAKLEVINRLLPGPANGMSAAGAIHISGGRKFTGLLDENGVLATQGFSVSMTGGEGLLKVSQVNFSSPLGGFSITSSGEKALLEMAETRVRSRDNIVLDLTGKDSAINVKQSFFSSSTDSATGAALFQAGTGGEINGKISLSETAVFDVTSATISASLNSSNGELSVEKSILVPEGDLRIESGAQGKTNVKENRLSSPSLIRIAAGVGGSCTGFPNTIQSFPLIQQICQ